MRAIETNSFSIVVANMLAVAGVDHIIVSSPNTVFLIQQKPEKLISLLDYGSSRFSNARFLPTSR
jgi:hypothetical protein